MQDICMIRRAESGDLVGVVGVHQLVHNFLQVGVLPLPEQSLQVCLELVLL